MREKTTASTESTTAPLHPEISAALASYAARLILGGAPERDHPQIAEHLAGCAACRAELDEIIAIATPLYQRHPTLDASAPAFDLSFLQAQTPAAPIRHWWYDQIGRLIIQLSEDLLRALTPQIAAIATRGDQTPHHLRIETPQGLQVSLEVLVDPDDPAHATIQVIVDQLAQDPFDQRPVTVTLRVGAQSWSAATDPIGVATFHQIPIADLPALQVIVEAA